MTRRPRRSTPCPTPPLCRSAGRDDRHAIMMGHLGVGAIEFGLIAVGPVHGGFEIVGDHNVRHATEGIKGDRKSTRLNSSHANISYAVFCLKKKHNKTRLHYC